MPVMPPTFRPSGQRPKAERERENDARRGSARERGYSAAWDKAAKGFLRDHPLCLPHQVDGLVCEAQLVDHHYPHQTYGGFWDKARWVPCCRVYHDGEKQALERQGLAALHAQADRLGIPRLDPSEKR